MGYTLCFHVCSERHIAKHVTQVKEEKLHGHHSCHEPLLAHFHFCKQLRTTWLCTDQIPCFNVKKNKSLGSPGLNKLVSSAPWLSTPLWCKQTVKPQRLGQRLLPQHLLCNWFSLRQAAGGKTGFLSCLSPFPLPSLCSPYIKPQPWKTRAELSQPWAVGTDGRGRGRCKEWTSKEVTSGCGRRLRLCTHVYIHKTPFHRLCLLGLIQPLKRGEIAIHISSAFWDVRELLRVGAYLPNWY